MSKPEWGEKRLCGECGTRFYDLSRKPALCPKCGAELKIVKPRPRRARPSKPPVPAPAAAANENPAAANKESQQRDKPEDGKDTAAKPVDGDDGDDDDDLIEDTSDLGDDKDDVSEVLEHVDSGVEDKA